MQRNATFELAEQIRKEYSETPLKDLHGAQRRLGEKYGLHYKTIWKIVNRKSYKEKDAKAKGGRTRAKLAPGDVRDIRTLAASGIWTNAALAKAFNVSPSLIRQIVLRMVWKDVT